METPLETAQSQEELRQRSVAVWLDGAATHRGSIATKIRNLYAARGSDFRYYSSVDVLIVHGRINLVNNIFLTGQLICHDVDEIAIVVEFLPKHIELTRAELGCVFFEVNQTDDPMVWDVAECFRDAASFELHQSRVQSSDWGRATTGMKRQYSVSGF